MSKVIKIHLKEAAYLKKKGLPAQLVESIHEQYTHYFYEERACKKCEWRPERHCDICDNCAAFKGGVKMATVTKVKDVSYIKAPIGGLKELKDTLTKGGVEFSVKKHFGTTKFKRPIKFTGILKDHQEDAVDAILKHKRGVIKAPPRSGKTVLSTAAVCRIGRKTIILAAQNTWLRGFRETFLGSKTQKPLTNGKESKIGFAKTYEDFLKYDVCLVTYQTFISEKGQKLLKKVSKLFDVLVVDEVHGSAAEKYALVISRLVCEYKIGLSGTPSRKDMKYVIASNLMGPIIYEAKVKRMRPQIRLTRTAYSKTYKGQAPWTMMVSSLEKDKPRLKLIAKWAIKDVEDGHMVIIPMSQVKPILSLVKLINDMADRKIAVPYYGGVKKEQQEIYVQKARDYKIKVFVGNAKMVSTGLNIPRASALYETIMSSNHENAEQRFSRVLTPWKDKPTPIIRYFLDDLNVRKRCMATEFFGTMLPKFKPAISDKDMAVLKGYFKAGSSQRKLDL